MDEERFNLSLRKLLKHFGVTAQREIEKAVDASTSSTMCKTSKLMILAI